MRSKTGLIIAVVVVCVPAALLAGERWRDFPGNNCVVAAPSVTNYSRTNGAISNNLGNSSLEVVCPAEYDFDLAWGVGSLTLMSMNVHYIDNQPASGSAGDLWCKVVRNFDGSVWESSKRYACSTFGGCPSFPPTAHSAEV